MKDTVGYRIKSRRNELNLTQKELGVKCLISEFTVSKYERNYSSPDVDTLKRLAKALDCSVDYLVGNTDEPNLTQYIYQDDDIGEIKVDLRDYPYELTPDEVKIMIETLKKYHFNIEAIIQDMRKETD